MTSDNLVQLAEPDDGEEAYKVLASYSAVRLNELSRMFAPVVEVTDEYGSLVSRLVWDLGAHPPQGDQDRVVRDLMADTFDFLVAWRRVVLEGQLGVAYPLARRAYESLSLLVVCAQDARVATNWDAGKRIGNAAIRRALAELPMKESAEKLHSLYSFFSMGAHPNRDLIPKRYLGAGNNYVLGSIGQPDLVLTADHLMHLLDMWFWFVAALGFHYRHVTDARGTDWGRDYMATADQAVEVAEWLTDAFNQLLEQGQKERQDRADPPAKP